jgi:phage terminase large subunit-like protein
MPAVARRLPCVECGGELNGGFCEPCGLIHIDPQPGPQTEFHSTRARVKFYGGAAGGGKTWSLLIDCLARALEHAMWAGLIVRSLRVLMKVGGGAIWAEAQRVYAHTGARFNQSDLVVSWPNGSTLTFRQVRGNANLWNGPSYDYIGFEEAQEVEATDIVKALTRLRSVKGIEATLAATMNPKRGHGLVEWIRWYLLPSGEPDPARSGVVRWFARSSSTDEMVFGATAEEAEALAGRPAGSAQSYTYIRALLEDNPALTEADPSYAGRLALQGRVREAQLARGNWFVGGDEDGPLARDRWVPVIAPLQPIVRWIRAWDKAATRPHAANLDPDYTAGVLLGFDISGRVYLAGLAACREDVPKRDLLIQRTAALDGHMVTQIHKQAPGDAGKTDVHHTRPLLAAGSGQVAHVRERKAKESIERVGGMALDLELGMRDGKPVGRGNLPGGEFEPRFFVLDGPPQAGWPGSYREGWLLERYRDAGEHPPTLGELVWSQLDPWPRGEHDDIPDAMADAHAAGSAGPSRRLSPAARARALAGRR